MLRRYTDLCERLIANSVLVHHPTMDCCWEWIGKRTRAAANHYGSINVRVGGKHTACYAHRVAFEAFTRSTIPEGYHVDHLCYNTLCINPAHLEAVPPSVNYERRRMSQ